MTGFLLAMLSALLAGLGARDQIAMADLSEKSGQAWSLLVVAVGVSAISCAFATWAGMTIAPELTQDARLIFASFALVFAGLESLLIAPRAKPAEPTQSLAAYGLVTLAYQVTDAARFLVLAMAVVSGSVLAGAGGFVASILSLTCAWSAPELFERHRIRPLRRGVGWLLIAVAALIIGTLIIGD